MSDIARNFDLNVTPDAARRFRAYLEELIRQEEEEEAARSGSAGTDALAEVAR